MLFFAPLIFLSFILLSSTPALAVEAVGSPSVTKGLLELDYKGGYEDKKSSAKKNVWETEPNITYGFSKFFKMNLEGTFQHTADTDLVYKKTKLKGTFLIFSEKNKSIADLALRPGIGFAQKGEGADDYSLDLLLRKKIGSFTHIANFGFKRDFGDAAVNGTNIIYRWQTRIAVNDNFSPAIEILGDSKKKNSFNDHSLRIGPNLIGSYEIGRAKDATKLGYEVGYLWGATNGSSDGLLKWRIKLEKQF
jgi:hypothetical protein